MTWALIRSFKLRIEFLKFSHDLSGKYILCLMKIQGPMNHIQMPIDKMRAKLIKSYNVQSLAVVWHPDPHKTSIIFFSPYCLHA